MEQPDRVRSPKALEIRGATGRQRPSFRLLTILSPRIGISQGVSPSQCKASKRHSASANARLSHFSDVAQGGLEWSEREAEYQEHRPGVRRLRGRIRPQRRADGVERRRGRLHVCFGSHGDFLQFICRNRPRTEWIVLPVDQRL
jgi:hypothetical protein